MKNSSCLDLYLDVGSTFIKWNTGCDPVIKRTEFPLPFKNQSPYYEVNANAVLAVIRSIISAERPERLFLSVQMHGYVLLKKGYPVTGYVSWRDERGASVPPAFHISPEYGVAMKPNLPRLSLQTQKEDADEFCTLGSFLVKMLTGTNRTHITDAAASGFYNVKRKTADECIYRLPQTSDCVESAGTYEGCAVYTPVGDQQAAVLGGTAEKPATQAYILNLGTAGQLCALAEGFAEGDFESRPFFGAQTLCTVTRLPGGEYLGKKGDEETLLSEYRKAIGRLPERNKIFVMGGAAEFHREKLERVLNRLDLPYAFCRGGEALNGLKILSEEVL